MDDVHLQNAIFERIAEPDMTLRGLADKHGLSLCKFRVALRTWSRDAPESQPESPTDIKFQRNSPGRPCSVARRHELIIVDGIQYFAWNIRR